MSAAAKDQPNTTPAADPDRTGVTVRPEEMIPGDQIRDQGVLRTVSHIEQTEDDRTTVLVCFTPRDGYAPHLRAVRGFGLFVLRANCDQ
jgi:hypothetical protein